MISHGLSEGEGEISVEDKKQRSNFQHGIFNGKDE
jgi:hypothetical protein